MGNNLMLNQKKKIWYGLQQKLPQAFKKFKKSTPYYEFANTTLTAGHITSTFYLTHAVV